MNKTLTIFSILVFFVFFAGLAFAMEGNESGTRSHHYFYTGGEDVYTGGNSSGPSHHYFNTGTEPYVERGNEDRNSGRWERHYFYPGDVRETGGAEMEGMGSAITEENAMVSEDTMMTIDRDEAVMDESRSNRHYFYSGGETTYQEPESSYYESKGNYHYFYTGARPFAASEEMTTTPGHWGHHYFFPW